MTELDYRVSAKVFWSAQDRFNAKDDYTKEELEYFLVYLALKQEEKVPVLNDYHEEDGIIEFHTYMDFFDYMKDVPEELRKLDVALYPNTIISHLYDIIEDEVEYDYAIFIMGNKLWVCDFDKDEPYNIRIYSKKEIQENPWYRTYTINRPDHVFKATPTGTKPRNKDYVFDTTPMNIYSEFGVKYRNFEKISTEKLMSKNS